MILVAAGAGDSKFKLAETLKEPVWAKAKIDWVIKISKGSILFIDTSFGVCKRSSRDIGGFPGFDYQKHLVVKQVLE